MTRVWNVRDSDEQIPTDAHQVWSAPLVPRGLGEARLEASIPHAALGHCPPPRLSGTRTHCFRHALLLAIDWATGVLEYTLYVVEEYV